MAPAAARGAGAPPACTPEGSGNGLGRCGCKLAARMGDLLVPLVVLLVGAVLGLALPPPGGGQAGGSLSARLSGIIGWMYTLAWSVSFYPQVVINYQRKSVVGLSFDYQLLNLVGFACYLAFNCALYFDSHVQQEYREAHGGASSAVQYNDVVFAANAEFATACTMLQVFVYYDYPPLQPAERLLRRAVLCSLAVLFCGATVAIVLITVQDERYMTWLIFLSCIAQVKVAISIVKYMPQVWMNYRRRSTVGWSITNVLLDFSGGALSTAQLLLDAWRENALSGITGDLAKLFLGSVSIIFDVVFMAQHYWLYRHGATSDGGAQRLRLVPGAVADDA